jgi:hypothetical protein
MDELLATALPIAEILIIKRDFDLLKKIATNLKPEVQVQFTPFTALFCHESMVYLNKKGQHVEIEQIGEFSIKDIRQKAKLFDMSINKQFQSIDNVDRIQDEYFIRLMKYPELSAWNLHDNIGVYYDKNYRIVSNTHYSYYVFQDEKNISKPYDLASAYELEGKDIHDFGYDMGRIIGSISSGLASVRDFMVSDFSMENIELNSRDLNTNRCSTFGNAKYKSFRLFILHIISSIGLILYVLKKSIIRESGLLLRLEYITYHYALKRLEKIKIAYENNGDSVNDEKLYALLLGMDFSNGNQLRNTDFRNCMMHFELIDKEGNSLINREKFNTALPMCGLVESQFNGMSYDEYKNAIETELVDIYDRLYEYLDLF